jgi:hypothetical protein
VRVFLASLLRDTTIGILRHPSLSTCLAWRYAQKERDVERYGANRAKPSFHGMDRGIWQTRNTGAAVKGFGQFFSRIRNRARLACS